MLIENPTRQPLDPARALAIPIKELSEHDRPKMLAHLVSLSVEDRYLRFGSPLSDTAISDYVDRIDFEHDTVFGIHDDQLQLVAAGHFAPLPEHPMQDDDNTKRVAEFGLSVSESARGRGIGTALFVRAEIHARNLGITILFMHCLTQNKAMMRIARRAGMEISYSLGEADAFVTLAPADAGSVLREAFQEQIAVFDYAFKRQLLSARELFAPVAMVGED